LNLPRDEALEQRLESLTTKTDYPSYEILVAQNDTSPGASACLSHFPHRWLSFVRGANDSAAKNYGASQTDAPWLLFLDGSIEAIDSDWLTIMAEHVQRPEVGAVGAHLLNRSGSVEHAGIVVGVNGAAQPAFQGCAAEHHRTNRLLQVTRNCSAVSSACMLVRREVFNQVSGFDERLSGTLADVDLCLKMRREGYLIIYTPFAKLYWHETLADKLDDSSKAIMRQRWADVLERDPYYNPNLSRERTDFSLGK
jgi:GT2 family glycosyltransferase